MGPDVAELLSNVSAFDVVSSDVEIKDSSVDFEVVSFDVTAYDDVTCDVWDFAVVEDVAAGTSELNVADSKLSNVVNLSDVSSDASEVDNVDVASWWLSVL